MVLDAHVVLCVTVGFFEKKILPQKWGKWGKNGPKIGFFEFVKKSSPQFLSKFLRKSHTWKKSGS